MDRGPSLPTLVLLSMSIPPLQPGYTMSTTHRTQPTHTEVLSVMRLLADVAALKSDPPAQRQLLVEGLCRMVGTNQAFLFAANGWSIDSSPIFTHQTLTADQDPVFLQYMSQFGVRLRLEADPFCHHSIRSPATLQNYSFEDVLPTHDAERDFPDFVEVRHAGRVADGLVSLFRTGEGGRSVVGVGMHQFGQSGRLSDRDRNLVAFAVAELKNLVDRGHVTLAAGAVPGLTPRLQQVLDRLLAGQAPKTIARELSLSVETVREHFQRLYRHFQVSGRDELAAKFIGQIRASPMSKLSERP